jgi:putative endonuclease
MNRREKGRLGERKAEEYLVTNGYEVLARNYRTRRGEVDLIARKGTRIAFVEVKCWDALPQESLQQAIGPQKRRRIVAVAASYLASSAQAGRPAFDVILLQGGRIVHLQDAFGGRDSW